MVGTQQPLTVGHHLLPDNDRLLHPPHLPIRDSQIRPSTHRVGMLGTQQPLSVGHYLLLDTDGLLHPPHLPIRGGQIRPGTHGVGIIGTQQPLTVGHHLLLDTDGLLHPPRLPIRGGQIRPDTHGVGIIGTQQPLTVGCQTLPVDGCGGVQAGVEDILSGSVQDPVSIGLPQEIPCVRVQDVGVGPEDSVQLAVRVVGLRPDLHQGVGGGVHDRGQFGGGRDLQGGASGEGVDLHGTGAVAGVVGEQAVAVQQTERGPGRTRGGRAGIRLLATLGTHMSIEGRTGPEGPGVTCGVQDCGKA